MPLPERLARFNRYVTNPIARLAAGRLPWFCILIHVGRRSGRTYRTPLNIFRTDNGFVIALTYGPDTDWLKNVLAAGGCRILYRGEIYELTEPRFLPTTEGMASMPPPVRFILRRIDVTEFLHLSDRDQAA